MKKAFKSLAFFMMMVMVLGIFSGCNKETAVTTTEKDNEAARFGGTLTIHIPNDPQNLNYLTCKTGPDSYMSAVNYEGLTSRDERSNITPCLAESWEISDDALTYTFHLRKGVKWHDGEEFTADDVIFSCQFFDAEDVVIFGGTPGVNGEWKKVDDYTVTMTLEKPSASTLLSGMPAIIPEHIYRDVPPSKYVECVEGQTPVYTGPFKFVEYKVGESVTFEAFEDYWGGRPYLDRVVLQIVPDADAAFAAFESGQIDLMSLDISRYNMLKDREGFEFEFYSSGNMRCLFMNTTNEILSNRAVRKAVSHCVDRQAIIATNQGGAFEMDSCFTHSDQFYNPEAAVQYPFDIEKAKSILEEDGWKLNADGIYEKDGKVLEFEMTYWQQGSAEAVIIPEDAIKAGIKLNPRSVEVSIFAEMAEGLTYEMAINGSTMGPSPYGYNPFYIKGGLTGYENPEITELFEKADAASSVEEQKEIWDKVQFKLTDDAIMVWIYSRQNIWGYGDNINFEEAQLTGGTNKWCFLNKTYIEK